MVYNGPLISQNPHVRSHQPSPSLHSTAFSPAPPTPPPASSTAAFPPFQLGGGASDLRRHQSLGNGYTRSRDRAERTGALLSPDQREDSYRRGDPNAPLQRHDPPPTSPIGLSMWSVQAGDNGWANVNQLSNTFDNLQLNRRDTSNNSNNDFGYQQPQQPPRGGSAGGNILPPMPMTAGPIGEPSWVAGLVGHDIVPRPRSAHTPHSQWSDGMHRPQQGMLPPQQRWDQGGPLGYMPQQHQQQVGGYGMPMRSMSPHVNPNMGQYPGYPTQPMHGMGQQQGYMGAPMYNTPPPTAHVLGPQDQAVIELARSKGLNPANFNCRPPIVSGQTPWWVSC